MCVFSATRERDTNEIIPASARQSRTVDGNDADKAIDLDFSTRSFTRPARDGTGSWLEITLPVLSCIERVVWYWSDGDPGITFTCTGTDCSRCKGYCRRYTLTVSTVISTDSIPQPTDCRLGDTVRLEGTDGISFLVDELAVIGEQGEIRYWYVRYTVVVL